MPKKFISLDIETDFRRKILNIGWCGSYPHNDQGKEFFIWQDEDRLYYDQNCDNKYKAILPIWGPAVKTPLGQVLKELINDTEGRVVVGWNIKPFDIPIIHKYIKKILEVSWEPLFFDGYAYMRKLIKEDSRLLNKLKKFNGLTKSGRFPSMTAEAMFKYLTGCQGYQEYHTALYDAQDERHLIKQMTKMFNLNIYKSAERYMPKPKIIS